MTKYEFIDDLIELFKKLDGKSDEIKKHNLDRYVEYFLLNLPVVVGQSEQLEAIEDLKEWAYDNCNSFTQERLNEIIERL